MKGKNILGRLFYYFKKNDENGHIDESDALICSIGLLLSIFGMITFFNAFYDSFFAKYLNIPDIVFFGISIFSLYFLLVMKLQKGSRKSILLMYTFPLIALLTFLFYVLKIDLSEANNGLSLIALSLTLLFMPLDKIKEEYQTEIKEIEENSFIQQQEIKDEIIDLLKKSNSNLLEIIDDLMVKQEGYSDKIGKSVDELKRIEGKIESIKQEFIDSKE